MNSTLLVSLLAEVMPRSPQNGYFGVLLYAFGLLLVLFLLINLDRRFREYIVRSLVRPFNFFADVRDRRILPNGQTTLLALICSGAFGISVATLVHGYAADPAAAPYFYTMFPRAVYDPIKGFLWDYAALLIATTAMSFIAIFFVALLLRLWAMFVRGRFYFADTYNVAAWSVLPIALLLAYDLILPRLDMDQPTAMLSLAVIGALFIWSYFRVLKGTGVLFDIYPTKIYGYGVLALALFAFLVFLFLQK